MTTPPQSERSDRGLDVVILFAGFTFLVYEVCWHRQLALVLGATVTAATLVLAVFMAGLGFGAWVWGRVGFDHRRPRRLLGLLLAGVGVFGGSGHLLLERAAPANAAGLAIVMLLVPTFLMGGVLPLVSKLVVRRGGSVATALGRLYGLETLGSTLGGLLAGFVLLGALGQRGTLFLAAGIDLVLAGWLLTTPDAAPSDLGPDDRLESRTAPSTGRKSRRAPPLDPGLLRRVALVATFACGFAMLGLQVLWLRMLRIYLTNTSYTFALVSSLTILGAFVGSWVFARRGRAIVDHPRALWRAVLLMALTTALGLVLLMKLPQVLLFPFDTALASPLVRVLVLPFVAALLVVFPPAAFSGFAFPLACRMVAASRSGVSRDVGLVLMTNTAGSVIGPIIATFVLLPTLGTVLGVTVLMAVLLVVASYLHRVREANGAGSTPRYALLALAGVLAAIVVASPDVRILPPSFVRFDRSIMFYRESVEGTLSVAKDPGQGGAKYTFVNNAAVIGSSYDAVKVVKMVGHLPFLLGLEARDVLVIGFGIGVTTSAIASHPEVASIECVELVPGLKDAAVFYRDLNHDVAADPRLHLHQDDGRHFLATSPDTYDLISCDPTHPVLGSGNLYTRDYFDLCRAHLSAGGMVSQYLPLHKLRTEDFLGLIATFHDVFPHSTVWLGHFHAVLLGSNESIVVDYTDWAERVGALGSDRHFYVDPDHLAATLVLDGGAIEGFAADVRINTDDRSYTEFFAPACLDADNIVKNLSVLLDRRVDVGSVFRDVPDPARLARFVEGNQLMSQGLVHKLSGDLPRSRAAIEEACRVNPENQEYPFLLKLYF